jgi:hypothetical protein
MVLFGSVDASRRGKRCGGSGRRGMNWIDLDSRSTGQLLKYVSAPEARLRGQDPVIFTFLIKTGS